MAKTSILVVDDDVDIREFVALRLELGGYVVSEADCGPAAIEALEDDLPAVMLLDVRMPTMSGLDVLDHLIERYGRLPAPVVVMSARADTATVHAALQAGAAGYLIKPFDLDELVATVRDVERRPVG